MADETFHLVSDYAPMGDQPQAIQQPGGGCGARRPLRRPCWV